MVEVREGRPEDAVYIGQLIERESGEEFDLNRIANYLKEFPSSVAIEQGEIVGFCYSSTFAPDILEILNILVDRKFQNKNIGSELLETVEKNSSSFSSIILVNSMLYTSSSPKRSAESFYLKHGYQVVHRTQNTNVFIKTIQA